MVLVFLSGTRFFKQLHGWEAPYRNSEFRIAKKTFQKTFFVCFQTRHRPHFNCRDKHKLLLLPMQLSKTVLEWKIAKFHACKFEPGFKKEVKCQGVMEMDIPPNWEAIDKLTWDWVGPPVMQKTTTTKSCNLQIYKAVARCSSFSDLNVGWRTHPATEVGCHLNKQWIQKKTKQHSNIHGRTSEFVW